MLTILLCLKNEKGKKRKEMESKHVVGGEGDESDDVKTKEKWFGKQNKKEDETKVN